MLNSLGRLIFTSTAIAPVGFTYAWAARSSDREAAILAATIAAILCIFAGLFLILAKQTFERVALQPRSVEAADRENVAFLLLYVSPLFTSSFSQINWSVVAPTLFVFAAVTATGYSYHFNPILGLMGWHAYRISDRAGVTYIVFTRRQMRSTLDELMVVQLTEYVLLDVG